MSFKNKSAILFILTALLIVLYIDLFPKVMKDWQTLIAGSFAMFAAILTVGEMRAEREDRLASNKKLAEAKVRDSVNRVQHLLDDLRRFIVEPNKYECPELYKERLPYMIEAVESLDSKQGLIINDFLSAFYVFALHIKKYKHSQSKLNLNILNYQSVVFKEILDVFYCDINIYDVDSYTVSDLIKSYFKDADIFNNNVDFFFLFNLMIDIPINPDKYIKEDVLRAAKR